MAHDGDDNDDRYGYLNWNFAGSSPTRFHNPNW
jgi:hypothetical protein